jgi:hypothetical protein
MLDDPPQPGKEVVEDAGQLRGPNPREQITVLLGLASQLLL